MTFQIFTDYNANIGIEQDTKSFFFKNALKRPIPLNMDNVSAYTANDSDGKVGNIIKFSYNTGTLTNATVAGLTVKNYLEGGIIAGGEPVGLAVFLKDKATKEGTVSAIATFHRHSSSDQTTQRGLAIFGDVTDIHYYAGIATNLFRFVGANTPLQTGSLKDSDDADIKCDRYLVLSAGDRLNPTELYIAIYDTKN
jgi:hypothetical protein